MSTKVRSLATFAALALVCTALARADPLEVRSRSRRAQPTDEEKQEFMDGVNGARADRNASDMNELVSEAASTRNCSSYATPVM